MKFKQRVLAVFSSILFAITSIAPVNAFAQEGQELEQSIRELREQYRELMKEDYKPARRASSNGGSSPSRDNDASSGRKATVKSNRHKKSSIRSARNSAGKRSRSSSLKAGSRNKVSKSGSSTGKSATVKKAEQGSKSQSRQSGVKSSKTSAKSSQTSKGRQTKVSSR